MWWIYALLSAVFAALTTLFAKIGVSGISSNLAMALRTVVVLGIAWGLVFFRREQKDIVSLDKVSLIFLILSGIATGASWLFYFRALQLGNASQVAAVDKLSLVFIFILSVLFFHETFTLKSLAGIICIAVGAWLMIK